VTSVSSVVNSTTLSGAWSCVAGRRCS